MQRMIKVEPGMVLSDHVENVAEGAALYTRYLLENEKNGPASVAWKVWQRGYTADMAMVARDLGAVIYHAVDEV